MSKPYGDLMDWKSFLIPYSKAVEELQVKFMGIRKEYTEIGEYSPIEFVTSRLKKVPSIVEKARKKGVPLAYVGDFIDDIAGIRIMCQFTDDIYKVVEIIHKLEAVDFKVAYERDYVKYGKKSGYKSYHIIIKYPVQTVFGLRHILAEIQIRTLAMNFWATIEHSISYKYKDKVPVSVQKRLRKAAIAASDLDSEMRTIRDEVIGAQLLFEEKTTLVFKINENLRYISTHISESDASDFHKQFDDIWNSGELIDLKAFLRQIKQYILLNDDIEI